MINLLKKMVSFILSFTFLIGMFVFPSDFFSSVSAAGESNVKTYAEIDADYDKFIYVGVDVIEVANGELTDGYVQPGDWLEYRMTILTDMYMGVAKPYMVYERDFFDVRVISSTNAKEGDSYTNTDYETNTKCQNGFMMGPDHPYSSANQSAVYHTLTSLPAAKLQYIMGFCEVDETIYANWDLVFPNIGIATSIWNSNFPMTEDEWFVGWYVRVKEGLADGTTGTSSSPETIWQHNINPQTGKGDGRRLATISTADALGTAGSSQTLANRYNVVQAVLLEDTYHTFTIGEAPAVEEPVVVTKTVTFQTLDGTVIETAEYAEGATVTVPEVDGLVTWTKNYNAVELGESFVMGQKALTYTAILDTDKFNVSIDLGGATYNEVPEGAEIVDGKLVIKAGFGETVDLTAVPLPEKEGYTGEWTPSSVTISSTRGATANIKWTRNTYAAKFFLDKETFESGAAAYRELTFVYGNKIPFAYIVVSKEDVKFAGWIDAATGEPANAETIYAENMNFYADWTEYNAAATIWGLDYATGEWVALATKKADAGSIISINDIKALVTEENFGSSAVTYAFATLTSDRAGERVSNDGYTMVEGANNIYIQTNVKFTYTLETPVFDEEGYITEEVILEEKTITTFKGTQVVFVPALADKIGYKFAAWVDANGNEYAAGNIPLDFAKGTDYTFTAKYELVEYTIEFVINKDATYKERVTAVEKVKLGDTITFANLSYVDAEGNETGLPEIGVNNEDQEYGPYDSLNGYKFKGWMKGAMASTLVDFDITEEIVLDPATLEELTYSEVITIRGEWEAVEYNINVYYSDMVSDNAELIYNRKIIYTAKTGSQLTDVYSAITEVVKHDFPEGFRFYSWRTDDGDFAPSHMPAYGLDLYAYYSPIQLSVYIDYNCSTPYNPVPAEKCIIKSDYSSYLFYHDDIENSIPEGMSMSVADLVRNSADLESMSPGEEYEFAGWQVCHVKNDDEIYKRDCWTLGVNDENTTIAKSTIIFQARWKLRKYKVTWVVDGTETKTEVIFGEKIPVPENPEKVGYTFVGWNPEVPETMPANNLEFTAAFTVNSYDLIFDANGGSWADGTTEKKASNSYESSITIPENPEKIGHTFDGWDIEIPETMPAQNVVAKAKWIKNTYKITWIVDGTETKTEVIFGEKIPVPENHEKVGYTFVGWNPEVPETMPANNLEFTAAFRANSYDAVFNANGGLFFNGSSTKTNSVKYDSVIPTPETPVRMGYDFIGWSPEIGIMDSVYGKMFMSVWSARSDTRYVVETYKMNALGEYEKKSIQSLNGITDSTVYANYSIDDGFILNEEKSILNGIVAPEGSLVLKVYIDRKTYTFTTTVDGNSVSTDYLYGAVVTQPTNPAKTGYTFAGWSSEVPSVMPADNVTVEALWQVNSYKITWIVNGKETVTNVNYGEKIVVPSDIIKGGYKFVGWDKEIPETMPADSLIFTAEFELSFRMSICNPSTTTISYGDSIILHSDMNVALPSGWSIKWTADNGNFSYDVSSDGTTCTISPNKSGDTTFTATVYDENENEITKDTQTMKSKAGFFDKFIAFFKKLFGATKVIPQAFKGMF